MEAVKISACCFHSFFPVYSYNSQSSPGKKPLVQSREETIFSLPLSSVRGEISSGLTVFAFGISCSITWVCFSASRKTEGNCICCAETVEQQNKKITTAFRNFCFM